MKTLLGLVPFVAAALSACASAPVATHEPPHAIDPTAPLADASHTPTIEVEEAHGTTVAQAQASLVRLAKHAAPCRPVQGGVTRAALKRDPATGTWRLSLEGGHDDDVQRCLGEAVMKLNDGDQASAASPSMRPTEGVAQIKISW